jgi:hypothetical protein
MDGKLDGNAFKEWVECHDRAVAKAYEGRVADVDKCEERAVSEMEMVE